MNHLLNTTIDRSSFDPVPFPDELFYSIALTCVPRIGDRVARKLLAHCGSAEAIFHEPLSSLGKIQGIGASILRSLRNSDALHRAEQEWKFLEKNGVMAVSLNDPDYPHRLKRCDDAPIVLYHRGSLDLNPTKVVAVVGTRKATAQGKQMVRTLLEGLVEWQPLVVSGLAMGVDVEAHRVALELGIPTAAVLGHGLDRMYPAHHRKYAEQMVHQAGGLITDFRSGTGPDRENFPKRNRIIAGLCDALIVIESGRQGGSMITAEIAHSYHRDVFAVPGRPSDAQSAGCHFLIQNHKAMLLDSARELAYQMGWERVLPVEPAQSELPVSLSSEDHSILQGLRERGRMRVDELSGELGLSLPDLSMRLLQLELNGLVRTLPGKWYEAA